MKQRVWPYLLLGLSLMAGEGEKAVSLLKAGRLTEAVTALNHWAEQKPTEPQAWVYLGLAHLAQERPQAASKTAQKALELAPQSADAQLLYGLVRLETGTTTEALPHLQRASWQANDRPMVWFARAFALERAGRTSEAVRFRQRGHALAPSLPLQAAPPKGTALVSWFLQEATTKGLCRCCTAYGKDSLHREDLVQGALRLRGERQARAASRLKVFADFHFQDRLIASGITFEHTVVEDAGVAYKPVHYDHGSGVALADVDGDGLSDIYFVNQLGPNQLWRNMGQGRFEDITAAAGVDGGQRIGVAASFADIDNDGDPDLFFTSVRGGNVLWRNDGKGRFSDITQTAGLGYSGHSSGAAFFDVDNDGKLDLFLANVGTYTIDQQGPGGYWIGMQDAFSGHLKPNRYESSRLYRNLGDNRFEDVSKALGLLDQGFCGDASFSDLNGDGWMDLYLLNMQGDDHFYLNQQGKHFKEQTAAYFPKTPWGSMGIKFFDYDNDGKQDLLVTDMHSDMSEHIPNQKEKLKADMQWPDAFLQGGGDNVFGNAFYWNTGGRFEEISDAVGAENYWPWGVTVADLNADGWEDVFVASSMNFPFRYGVNSLLLNNEGASFEESAFLLGVEPRPKTVLPWFVLDCDGADQEHELCTGRRGWQTIWGAYGSRSSAVFDADGDGDLDLLTAEFNSEPRFLFSDLAQKKPIHWLQLKLVGTRSNRDGLGARIVVHQGKRQLTRFHDGKSGYLSQSSAPIYVGLGEQATVDRIEVFWPSGTHQVRTRDLAANRLLVIEEQ